MENSLHPDPGVLSLLTIPHEIVESACDRDGFGFCRERAATYKKKMMLNIRK